MNIAHLRLMADQIARNFAVQGHDKAVAATADHLVRFWDPRMKAAIVADAKGSGRALLSPIARGAIDLLARGVEPPPQTHATEFATGGSDAG